MRSNAIRAAIGAVVLIAATATAWAFTRTPAEARSASGAHDHAAMTARDEGQGPVSLGAIQAQRIGVTYAPVTVGELAREIRTVGQVTYDETRVKTIAPKVDGWVERLYVDFTGQPVSIGQPLFAVYSPMLVQAQEELLLARRLTSDVASADGEARRNAEELLHSARRRLAYWDVPATDIARIEQSGEVQRTIVVRSSVGGTVVDKNVLAGQRIAAGDALYRVADLSTVWVDGEIYEQDLRAVRVGLAVTATFDAYPGESWRGTIAYVYPTVNPETRTARVRVSLANPALRLKPGMFATLRFAGTPRADVLTVPRTAVLSTGERHIVFVRRGDGRLEPHLVQIGGQTDERVEIVSGLTAGDTVVASATFLVDAESNLGTLMGGMGDMPGMDMTKPVAPRAVPRQER